MLSNCAQLLGKQAFLYIRQLFFLTFIGHNCYNKKICLCSAYELRSANKLTSHIFLVLSHGAVFASYDSYLVT